MGNTFGRLFRVSTFGESHGGGVGVVIDGCPPRLEISEEEIQIDLRQNPRYTDRYFSAESGCSFARLQRNG
jgi:chorismate synthase